MVYWFRPLIRYFSDFDRPLLVALFCLFVLSVANMYGIVGQSALFFRHLTYVGLSLLTVIVLAGFDYRFIRQHSLPALSLYLGAVGLLFLTLFFPEIRGTRAWIAFAGLTFEPSELAKLALIVLLAKYFSQRHSYIHQIRHVIASGIYYAVPTLIVLGQPDLGSAIILTIIWLGMLLTVGISWRHFFALLVIGLLIAYTAWLFLLAPYQKDRILSFLNPQADPHGSGYNLIQSQIAIGSGSWLGNGWGKGSQARLGFLPEPHNDFVFAALVEQFGFTGGAVAVGLIGIVIFRIMKIGQAVYGNFGKLFSLGMAIFIFSHLFVSIGVDVGLMPITGLPLSFLSYGGSHMLSVAAGLGIVQSMRRYG